MKLIRTAIFSLLCAAPVSADTVPISGHVKYQGSAFQNVDDGEVSGLHSIDGRLKSGYSEGLLTADIQGTLLGAASEKTLKQLFPLSENSLVPNDKTRALRMTSELSDDERFQSVLRMDRLSLQYGGAETSISAGRQALSLGNGMSFHVLDIFNPFAPTAIDKEYKTGDDIVRVAHAFGAYGESELFFIPRRDPETYDFEPEQHSTAFHHRVRVAPLEVDFDLLLAEHYDDTIFGAGFSRDVSGATVRSDFSFTQTEEDTVFSALANVDAAFPLFNKNAYWFLEFYHSGFGSGGKQYLPGTLERNTRIARGELYTLGRNYFSTGGKIELESLLNLYLSSILNLQDRSSVLQARFVYDIAQNTGVQLGVTMPTGDRGSEFGLESDPAQQALPRFIEYYLRFEQYF